MLNRSVLKRLILLASHVLEEISSYMPQSVIYNWCILPLLPDPDSLLFFHVAYCLEYIPVYCVQMVFRSSRNMMQAKLHPMLLFNICFIIKRIENDMSLLPVWYH